LVDSLNYERYGQGQPILFLHGFGPNLHSWKFLVPYLEKKYELFLIDLKGFGKSPQPRDGKYSLVDQADLITDFISQKKLKNVCIAGSSYGGAVALMIARKFRLNGDDNLGALIMVCGAAYRQKLPLVMSLLKVPMLSSVAQVLPYKLMVEVGLRRVYYDPRKVSSKMIDYYAVSREGKNYFYALNQVVTQLIPENADEVEKEYCNITIPTLIIHGREDRIIPLDLSQRLAREIKNSELVILPECGHLPQEELPKITATRIDHFLSKIRQT